MTDAEVEATASEIIRTSRSEEEIRRRLRDELGYRYAIALNIHLPTDAVGRQARELVRGLGGLVMANGAMVMAMLHGHEETIIL